MERGVIEHPDLILLADETLLSDPVAGVLAGRESAAGIFINAESAEPLIEKQGDSHQVVVYDVTGLTRDVLGTASALSARMGAAAARLVGIISEDHLVEAMSEEFDHLRIPAGIIEKNQQIARKVFAALPVFEFDKKEYVPTESVVTVGCDDPLLGTPSVLDAGNTEQRNTGPWRVERPIIDREACTRCGLCFVLCPDGAVALDEEGYPVIDYGHCKGCMICQQLCPLHAIESEKETQAW